MRLPDDVSLLIVEQVVAIDKIPKPEQVPGPDKGLEQPVKTVDDEQANARSCYSYSV